MEEKQKEKRKVEEKEETGRRSSKTGAITNIAMALSIAEEATTSSAGNNRVYSNKRSGKNKYGGNKGIRTVNGNFF